MGKPKRNVNGLLQHAASIKNDTEDKVNCAIDALKRSKTKKINFKTVSELSSISTTTLYNNPVLRERISSLRAVKASVQKPAVPDMSARDEMHSLRQEIQKLKEEKKMLVTQLVELESLKTENQHLKALLSQKKLE